MSDLPHSREAEEAVIGSVLINPDLYVELSEFLSAKDFYLHRLQFIWRAFDHLARQRLPIDPLTVSETLNSQGRLAEIGGQAYLTALLNQVPTTLNADAYARLVRSTATRRGMLAAANQIAMLAYDESQDLMAVAEQSVKALEQAVLRATGSAVIPLKQALAEAYERLDRLSRTAELPGTPTGLVDLDLKLGNLQAGLLYVVGARPGQGKTSLLLTIARQAAQAGKQVAIFSLEMPNEKITNRLLAQQTGIDVQLIDTGKLDEGDWARLTNGIEALETLPLWIDDTPTLTPLQLKAKCRRQHLSAGALDLVIVDYLQLMRSGEKSEGRVQEVGQISRALKALSKELQVPILAAAQLNREVEQRADKRPQLSDLRESGDIESDADVVMFLYQPDSQPPQAIIPTEIIIQKHRNGPVGTVPTLFNKAFTRFESAVVRKIHLNKES